MATKSKATSKNTSKKSTGVAASTNGRPKSNTAVRLNQYGIPDWRLEQPEFEVVEVREGPEVHDEIKAG